MEIFGIIILLYPLSDSILYIRKYISGTLFYLQQLNKVWDSRFFYIQKFFEPGSYLDKKKNYVETVDNIFIDLDLFYTFCNEFRFWQSFNI